MIRDPSSAFGMVAMSSRFAIDFAGSPCSRPSVTSTGIPRIVRVTGATVTEVRTA
ncbi:MAG: hypothetical protein QOD06_726 [Candidatus Binatota bacterium]|nr:hypothetical protein [Candidatus Binatota bacterium]